PEAGRAQPLLLAAAVPAGLEVGDADRQPDRHRDEDEGGERGDCELPAREFQGGHGAEAKFAPGTLHPAKPRRKPAANYGARPRRRAPAASSIAARALGQIAVRLAKVWMRPGCRRRATWTPASRRRAAKVSPSSRSGSKPAVAT